MERRGDYEAKKALPGPGAKHDITFTADEDVAEAERRREIIRRLESAEKVDQAAVTAAAAEFGLGLRQFNRYRKAFRESGRLTSLLRGQSKGGRGKHRKPERFEEIILEVQRYFDRHFPEMPDHDQYGEVQRRASAEGISVSLPTIRSRYRGIPQRAREERKFGKKYAAERYEALRGETPETTFPFERIQIDHTLVDVVCTGDVDRGHIGRPWVTFAIDEYTRTIVSMVVSWEYPNATTVAVLLARALTPKDDWLVSIGSKVRWPIWGRLHAIFVDNANELSGKEVQFGCKENNCPPPETRPPGRPHFGGIVERFVGTAMRRMRLLSGSTARKRGFNKGKTHNPNEKAEMSRAELELWLLEEICEKYHRRPHAGIGKQAPIKVWERAVLGTERKPGLGLPPEPDKTKVFLDFAEMQYGTIQKYGMKWQRIPYWGEVLRPFLDAGDKRKFVMKRNPYDLSRIWFKHPDDGEYHELLTTKVATPSLSKWEWREALDRLKAAGDEADVEAIDAAAARQRQLQQDARNKTAKHKRRRDNQRRDDAAKLVEEVTPRRSSDPPVEAPASPKADNTARRAVHFKVADV